MTIATLLACMLLAQDHPPPNPSPTTSTAAISAHFGMELDDLDFEIRRQQSALQVARAHLMSTQRLTQRGQVSRSELEQVGSDVRSLEARGVEAQAFRALKLYERDVVNGTVQPDEEKAFALVADLLRKQELMAQVELDHQTYRMKQQDLLLGKKAISVAEHANSELDFDNARLHVALARARQGQLAYGHLTRPGAPSPPQPDQLQTVTKAYLEARVQYYEIALVIAKSRLEMAREQFKRNKITQTDIDAYQKSFQNVEAILGAERKRLENPGSEPMPINLPRAP